MTKYTKISLTLLVLGIFFLIYKYTGVSEILNIKSFQLFIESAGIFAPIVFIIIYIIAILLFFSATILTISGGLIFGSLFGTVYVVFASTIAAQIAFIISRKLREKSFIKNNKIINYIEDKLKKRKHDSPFQNIFLLRTLFLPYAPLSYASGLVKNIDSKSFFMATLSANIIYTPAFVFLGDSILEGPKALMLPAAMILLVITFSKVLNKYKKI